MLLFLPIWFIGWTIAGGAILQQVISGQWKGEGVPIIWLFFWLAAELFVLYAFLWSAFGYEVITAEHGILTIKRSIFGYGPSRRFAITKISNLRASGFFAPMMSWSFNMAYWGISGGSVAFDYENKTQRLGINLNEDEAAQLVAVMKAKFSL